MKHADRLDALFDQEVAPRLALLDGGIILLTTTRETPDRVTIERRRLGTSIGLDELLALAGASPRAAITAEAHVEVLDPLQPVVCPTCGRPFATAQRLAIHVGRSHKADAVPALPPPPPAAPAVTSGDCSACGAPLLRHLRCADCAGLLGAGHDAGIPEAINDGLPLCAFCVAYRATARELGLA